MTKTNRIAVVGTGQRSVSFIEPLVTRFRETNELVALCDANPGRMEHHNNWIAGELKYHKVPTYHAESFDRMVKETRPDAVLVCTVDAFHHQYVIRAMQLGCDAITEKPMTTDAEKCGAILDAVKQTGRQCHVTFNARWRPGATLVKKLLLEGIIGDVIHVDMEWMLNTSHGADYFRRWHAEKKKSGGLQLHKSTHHFDLVNWWLDAVPQTVFGFGRLAFYGRKNAQKRGVESSYQRYTGEAAAKNDPFAFTLDSDDFHRKLYLDQEKHDGYQRDRNVFGDHVDIEDTMSLLCKYRNGVVLNYSLNAYLPREGVHVAFNGTKGRLEFNEEHGEHVIETSAPPAAPAVQWRSRCIVHPMFGHAYEVPIPKGEGGHDGSDPLLAEQIFSPNPPRDPYHRSAGHEQGAASILIGIAANHSFQSGLPVQIGELCPQLPQGNRLSELK